MTFPCKKKWDAKVKLWGQLWFLVPSYVPLSGFFSHVFTPTFFLFHPLVPPTLQTKASFCPVGKELKGWFMPGSWPLRAPSVQSLLEILCSSHSLSLDLISLVHQRVFVPQPCAVSYEGSYREVRQDSKSCTGQRNAFLMVDFQGPLGGPQVR